MTYTPSSARALFDYHRWTLRSFCQEVQAAATNIGQLPEWRITLGIPASATLLIDDAGKHKTKEPSN